MNITLSQDLGCSVEECDAGSVSEVMVAGAVYRYLAPPCVYLLYYVV